MTSQECVLDAVSRAQGILAEYIEPGPRDCARTLSKLFAIFADDELTDAVNALNLETLRAAIHAGGDSERQPTSPLYNRTSG